MDFLSSLKIRTRLIGAFAVSVLITVFIGIQGMNGSRDLADKLTDMYVNQLTPIKDLSNANMAAIYVNRGLYAYVIEEKQPEMDKIKATIIDAQYKKYNALFDKYQATELTDSEKALIAKVKAGWPAYLTAADKVMKFSYQQQNAEAMEVMTKEAMPAFQVVDDLLSELVDLNAKLAKEADDAALAKATIVRNFAIAAMAVSILISVVLAIMITNSITIPLAEGVRVAQAVAEGDLTASITVSGKDEMAQLLGSMRGMKDSLVKVVSNVRNGSESVATASAEIAQGNQDLSARTESQASALEETAASMEELSSQVKHNADNARQANQLASSASAVAAKGGEVVGRVVHTMKDINDSSRKIADIISVIDGIAFQTNILALNAAVEAARAGEQGRGFAVVASEVRSLAGRSADAAKEIKSLINASVEKVEHGTALVDEAGTTMTEVVSSIRRVSDLVGEISSASNEQAAGVAQVGEAVTQMDQVTQQNAALVEQMAAAASSLKSQAGELVETVAVFKLSANDSIVKTSVRNSAPKSMALKVAAKPKTAPSSLPAPKPVQLPKKAPTAKTSAGGDDDWETF